MTPEEAINASTINGAYAMDVLDTHGSIAIGKKASLIIAKPNINIATIPYLFTGDVISRVLIDGVEEYANYY